MKGDEGYSDPNAEPEGTFLNPRAWKKASLYSKTSVSWDTRVFTFKLETEQQTLGLPVGQHLMIRLKDPATRETIIRSYTPISDITKEGYMDVLVKVYFDSKERQGGKMSQALDSIPVGHSADFKGPIGKFEYHGKGICTVNGVSRNIKGFYMICGGSGITPIYQVLRAIMLDPEDPTKCVVLNGNRLLEDILCKEDLDGYASANSHKCKLLYTLTQAPDGWEGLEGRIAAPLLKEHVDLHAYDHGETMVLICGPKPLEKSCHEALREMGWKDDDLLFF